MRLILKNKKLLISPVEESHAKCIWEWRNEYATRQMSLNSEFIPWETHKKWFSKLFKNKNSYMYVGIFENQPVSMVRYDLSSNFKNTYEISILVKSKFQGIGLGKELLNGSLEIFFKKVSPNNRIIACVKNTNEISKNLFKKNGFLIYKETNDLFYYSFQPD